VSLSLILFLLIKGNLSLSSIEFLLPNIFSKYSTLITRSFIKSSLNLPWVSPPRSSLFFRSSSILVLELFCASLLSYSISDLSSDIWSFSFFSWSSSDLFEDVLLLLVFPFLDMFSRDSFNYSIYLFRSVQTFYKAYWPYSKDAV